MRRAMAGGGRAARPDMGGGDYFASMTDLMLGLIFIFIIMLVGFALNLHNAEHKLKAANATRNEAALARREMLHDVARILKGTLPVTIDEANGTLQLGGDILFPQGSAEAYPNALPKLRLLARALDMVLPCYALLPHAVPLARCKGKHKGRLDAVFIEGHADATPIDTPRFKNNWDLSAARASETFHQLVAAYPALATLENDRGESLIGVSGYGATRPVDDSRSKAAMRLNRRIELRFIMAARQTATLHHVIGGIGAARSP